MSAIPCAGCGDLLADDDRFCGSCGTPRPVAGRTAGSDVPDPAATLVPDPSETAVRDVAETAVRDVADTHLRELLDTEIRQHGDADRLVPPLLDDPPVPAAPPALPPMPTPGVSGPASPASPASRSRRTVLVIAAVVGSLLLAGGIGVGVVLGKDDDPGAGVGDPDARTRQIQAVRGIDNGVSVTSGPGREWTLLADSVIAGSQLGTMQTATEGASLGESLTIGDTIVVNLTSSGDDFDTEGTLAGVDAVTGEVRWERPELNGPCYEAGTAAFVCTRDEGGTALVDAITGTVRGTDADLFAYGGAAQGDSVYLVSSPPGRDEENWEDHSLQLTRYSVDDFDRVWSVKLVDDMSDSDQGNEFDGAPWVVVRNGRVDVYEGYLHWTVEASTGDLVAYESRGDEGTQEDGYRFEIDDETTRITDRSGYTLLTAPGYPWSSYAEDQGWVVRGHVGIGGTLYDLATGEETWSREDLNADSADGISSTWTWFGDGRFVEVSVYEGPTTILDAVSGETIWSPPGEVYNLTSTHDAVLGEVDGSLVVHGDDPDAAAWDRSLGMIRDEEWIHTIAVTPSSIVASAPDGLMGFTDFGSAPGSAGEDGDSGEDSGNDSADGSTGGDTDYVTACGADPVFEPVEAADANGGLTVTFTVYAICPTGQWLSSSSQRITLAGTGTGRATYASGLFDFTESPYWVPGSDDEPVTLTVVFPYEATYATTPEIQDAVENELIVVECIQEPGAYAGDVPSDPDYGTDPADPVFVNAPPSGTEGDGESALEALRRIAAEDEEWVSDNLEGAWMPQLSSKQLGTEDDGIVYDYDDILAEHLRLRARYDDVKLVWSSDWKSFMVPRYWVTLVGRPTPGWRPAAGWCPANGFTVDHCYAKRLLRDGPAKGATKKIADLDS